MMNRPQSRPTLRRLSRSGHRSQQSVRTARIQGSPTRQYRRQLDSLHCRLNTQVITTQYSPQRGRTSSRHMRGSIRRRQRRHGRHPQRRRRPIRRRTFRRRSRHSRRRLRSRHRRRQQRIRTRRTQSRPTRQLRRQLHNFSSRLTRQIMGIHTGRLRSRARRRSRRMRTTRNLSSRGNDIVRSRRR